MPPQRRRNDGNFAAYLKASMKAARIGSGAQLAEAAGIAQSLVSRWLNGKTLPSIEALRAIAEPLGVPMRDLVVRAGYMTPDEVGLEDEPVPPTSKHSIEDEIRADARIRPDRKEALINLLEALREEDSGGGTSVREERSA
jgi:transcriptional regulator with XRE-family HTH domain